jgi:hypothetical protein
VGLLKEGKEKHLAKAHVQQNRCGRHRQTG